MSNIEKMIATILAILFAGMTTLFILFFRTNDYFNNFSEEISGVTEDNLAKNQETLNLSATIEELNDQITELEANSLTLLERIEKLEDNTNATPPVIQNVANSAFQKQNIYIGSAITSKREWNQPGVEVKLNSADYPTNVKAVFEVGLSVVGGEAWARLVNKTTGAIMAVTEISHSTSITTWKTSPSFKLYSGSNTYALEIKSTSGEVANFSGARVVIE